MVSTAIRSPLNEVKVHGSPNATQGVVTGHPHLHVWMNILTQSPSALDVATQNWMVDNKRNKR